jgi:hypothetical protein
MSLAAGPATPAATSTKPLNIMAKRPFAGAIVTQAANALRPGKALTGRRFC